MSTYTGLSKLSHLHDLEQTGWPRSSSTCWYETRDLLWTNWHRGTLPQVRTYQPILAAGRRCIWFNLVQFTAQIRLDWLVILYTLLRRKETYATPLSRSLCIAEVMYRRPRQHVSVSQWPTTTCWWQTNKQTNRRTTLSHKAPTCGGGLVNKQFYTAQHNLFHRILNPTNSAVSTNIQNTASTTKALALRSIYEHDNCTSKKQNNML